MVLLIQMIHILKDYQRVKSGKNNKIAPRAKKF